MRHLTDLLTGLTALTLTVLTLLAVPVGLITYVRWPLPTTLPTVDEIQLALRSGIDPQLLIKTLAVIVWIIWAQLVIAVAAETVAAARGTTARRLPVLPGLQRSVAQLVAAVTLAVATLGPLRAIPATAAPLPATVTMTVTYPTLDVDTQQPLTQSTPAPDSAPDARPTESSYRVGPFDTFWSIADTSLGDGRRWSEIRDLNIGRVMPDGHRITETTERLTPGWLLTLPQDTQTPQQDNPQGQTREITVADGDNFWSIAENALNETWGRTPTTSETADYWQRLVDANRHRLAPPHDPNLIYPNQRFELPPVSAAPTTTKPASTAEPGLTGSPQHGPVVVETGDSFWSIAEDALTETWGRSPSSAETVGYFHQVVDVNRDRLLPPHDPNLIHPGQTLNLPPIPNDPQTPADTTTDLHNETSLREPASERHTEPATDTPIPTPDDPFTTSRLGTDDRPHLADKSTQRQHNTETLPPEQETDRHQTTDPTEPAVPGEATSDADGDGGNASELFPIASRVAGLGILSAGLIALIRRLRNTQLRQRQPGTIPTPPPPHTADTETTIRTAAAPNSTQFINLAVRAMANDIVQSHRPPPEVAGVHLNPDTLRLLLWTPQLEPPPRWQVDDNGRSWTLPTNTNIDQLQHDAQGVPAPYPTLVTVGHGDQTLLLLDLEHLGATQITGSSDEITATCTTMATELAASPIADDLHIYCVGFGHDLAHHERITIVDQLQDTLPAIETKAAAWSDSTSPSPLQARLSPGGDNWHPIIVLDPAPEPPDGAQRILEHAHTGRGVAAVVGYPTGNRWRLHIDNNTIRIDPLGHTYARRNLTPTEQTAVADIVAAANDPNGTPQDHPAALLQAPPPPQHSDTVAPDPSTETDTTKLEPRPAVELKVLGTVRIGGLHHKFRLRKCTEVVAYLAFHRHGVEADTLMEALWPQQPPNYSRLHEHISRTRTGLGPDPHNKPYLPKVTGGIYRISPQLRSNWDRFTHHLHQADQTTDTDEETRHLHNALELVEGTPFSGIGTSYTWAHTDGIITHITVTIDNTAHRLAQHALTNNQPEQATWATRQGLAATGACEHCYRNLMHAADTENNQVSFQAVFNELVAIVDADEGPDATTLLDPETIQLYEQHNRTRRRHTG